MSRNHFSETKAKGPSIEADQSCLAEARKQVLQQLLEKALKIELTNPKTCACFGPNFLGKARQFIIIAMCLIEVKERLLLLPRKNQLEVFVSVGNFQLIHA